MPSSATILAAAIVAAAGLSLGGLAWVVLRAFRTGAEAYSGAYSQHTARQFEDIFLFVPPRRIAEAGWACGAAAFLLVAMPFFDPHAGGQTLVGLGLGAVAALAALRLPRQALAFLRVRRRRRFNEQLVEALSHMSNALRAGFSITQSFETVVENGDNPIAQEFDVLLQQTRVGMSFNDALESLDRRVGSDDLTLVCTAIDISRRTGGNLTEIFDKIALTIRERMRIERRVLTLTAQGRLQGIIVGAMPVVVGVTLAALRPSLMMPFVRSLAGMISIAAVVILVSLGAWTIRKIIRIDV
jgi:tight adherence protein B